MIMARPRARFATFSASAGGRSFRAVTCAGRKTMISREASRRIRRIRLGHRDRCGSYLLSGAFREFVNRYEKQVRCLEPILGPGGLYAEPARRLDSGGFCFDQFRPLD